VTSPIVCGKSLVLRAATHRFDANRYQVIYLRGSIGKPAELFKLILQGMRIAPPSLDHSSQADLLRFGGGSQAHAGHRDR
jgi:hypothetical protein